MTWVKPSFAWVLYRSGYASKPNQTRILKLKVPHGAMAELLSACKYKHGGGGSKGRVQWDPARDLMTSEGGDGKEPRRMLRERSIQIGISKELSTRYVSSILCVEDVTPLAHSVGRAHGGNGHRRRSKRRCKQVVREAMEALCKRLPEERAYMPCCNENVLVGLGMKFATVAPVL